MRTKRTLPVVLLWVMLALMSTSWLAPGTAQAQGRPLTTPGGALQLMLGPSAYLAARPGYLTPGLHYQIQPGSDALWFDLALSYGVTSELELGALILPLSLSPGVGYNNPAIWGIYRLSSGAIEAGIQVGLRVPIGGGTAGLTFGLPAILQFSAWRLETGLLFDLGLTEGVPTSIRIPLRFLHSVGSLFLGINPGLAIGNFDSLQIPLMMMIGANLGSADLSLEFGWPTFLAPGSGDVLREQTVQVGLGINAYF